jgi:hypothetical protein
MMKRPIIRFFGNLIKDSSTQQSQEYKKRPPGPLQNGTTDHAKNKSRLATLMVSSILN